MGLSIIIPCYNEDSRVGMSLHDRVLLLNSYLSSIIDDFEIILVSDGSTDDTENVIIDLACSNSSVVACSYRVNKGKGNAIKEGVSLAHKDYILFMDADLSTDIKSIKVFMDLLSIKSADSIIGIRDRKYNSSLRRGLSILSHFCMSKILRLDVDDTQCGFKLLRADIFKLFCSEYQMCDNWLFDAELLVFLKDNNYSVHSKIVSWSNSVDSRVTIIGGTLSSCFELLRILLNRRHYRLKNKTD